MPLYISLPSIILLLLLTIWFAYKFWNEQKYPKPNNYPNRSIRKFFKDGLSTIYLLIATIFGLAVISIGVIAFV